MAVRLRVNGPCNDGSGTNKAVRVFFSRDIYRNAGTGHRKQEEGSLADTDHFRILITARRRNADANQSEGFSGRIGSLAVRIFNIPSFSRASSRVTLRNARPQ